MARLLHKLRVKVIATAIDTVICMRTFSQSVIIAVSVKRINKHFLFVRCEKIKWLLLICIFNTEYFIKNNGDQYSHKACCLGNVI